MRFILIGVTLLALAGCSIFGKKDGTEPMELVDIEQLVGIQKVWQKSVGAGQGPGDTRLTPVIDGDAIYVVDYKGQLQAFNHRTGKMLWQRDMDETLAGGIGLGQEQLLVGSDEGEVIALDQAGGREQWRTQLTGEILSIPVGGEGVVAVNTMDGRLSVLNAETGKPQWSYDSPPPRLTLRGRSSPVIAGTAVYAAFANGRLLAFDASNGLILWEQRVAMPKGRSDLERMVDILATPVLSDGIFYVSGYQGRLMAVSRGSGRPLWAVDSSSHREFWLHEGTLYLSDSDDRVLAYQAGSGQELWRNEQMLRRGLSGPVRLGDYLLTVDYKGYLHVLEAGSGELVGRTRIGRSGIKAPLLVHDGLLYVFSNNGKLAAYRIAAP